MPDDQLSGEEKLAALDKQFGLGSAPAAPAAKPAPPDLSALGGAPGEQPLAPTPEKTAPGPETAAVESPRSDANGSGQLDLRTGTQGFSALRRQSVISFRLPRGTTA